MFGGFPFHEFFQGQGMHPGRDSPEEVDNNKYYELLEVDKNASCQDIKKKYKVLARKLHPDKGGDPKKFAEITHAAEILSDPEKRKVYDSYGEKGINQGMSGHDHGHQDLFDLLSGGGGRRQGGGEKKSPNTSHKLSVTLSEIYHGVSKKISITRNRVCADCGGQGGSKVNVCGDCKGRGHVTKLTQLGPGMYSQSSGPCDTCRGVGKSIDAKHKCKKCKGNRTISEKKVIDVAVDKGCPNHHKYSFYGESDEEPGLKPGDLVVIIEEAEHPVFKRKKADLIMSTTISLKEALTGYKIKIDHLDGPKIIEGPAGDIVKPGDIRTIEELGMPLMRTPYKFGNLFIHFEVEFPAPGSLAPQQLEGLLNVLPGDRIMASSDSVLKTINYDKSQITENSTTIHSDYKEDEEEDPRLAGGRRVQCSGTIF
jgi:DnaJ homolog subfamily A member 2